MTLPPMAMTQVHNQTRTKELGHLAAELLDPDSKKPLPGMLRTVVYIQLYTVVYSWRNVVKCQRPLL